MAAISIDVRSASRVRRCLEGQTGDHVVGQQCGAACARERSALAGCEACQSGYLQCQWSVNVVVVAVKCAWVRRLAVSGGNTTDRDSRGLRSGWDGRPLDVVLGRQ